MAIGGCLSNPSDRLMGDKKCGGLSLPLPVVVGEAVRPECRPRVSLPSAAIAESRDDEGVSPPLEITPSVSAMASPTASSSARGGRTENDGMVPSPLVALLLRGRLLRATSNRLEAGVAREFATKLAGNIRLRSILLAAILDIGVGGRAVVELYMMKPRPLRRDNSSWASIAVARGPTVALARALPNDDAAVRIMGPQFA